MSNPLNEIRLNAQMVAMLYGTSLVQIPENESGVGKYAKRQETIPRFLGENKRNITILVNNPDHTFLPEIELALLTKMLEACNVNLGDVAIVNASGKQKEVADIAGLQPVIMLDFRDQPREDLFSIRDIGGVQILNAPSLSKLIEESVESRQLKIRLWSSLKMLFGI